MSAKVTPFLPKLRAVPLGRRLHRLCRLICALFLLSALAACDVTRHLDEGQQLVQRTPRFKGNQALDSDDLLPNIKTERNRRVVWPKAYLHIHNTGIGIQEDSSLLKRILQRFDNNDKFINSTAKWMRNVVGDPPELVSRVRLIQDCKNLESYYFSKGFFNARVRYQIRPSYWNSQKARIFFRVNEGERAIIYKIEYATKDSALRKIAEDNKVRASFRSGDSYDEQAISAERNRLTELFRNHGYYAFGARQIQFVVDTSRVSLPDSLLHPRVRQHLQSYARKDVGTYLISVKIELPDTNLLYTIDTVTVRILHDLSDTLIHRFYGPELTDSLRKVWNLPERRLGSYNPSAFKTTDRTRHILNYNMLERRLSLHQGELFSLRNYRHTLRQLQQLGVFSNTFVRYSETDDPQSLHATVDLLMSNRYYHQERLEAFQNQDRRINSNLPGVGGTIQVANRNTFRRAEELELQLSGNVFLYSEDNDRQINQLFYQYGVSLTFKAPHFYLIDTLMTRAIRLGFWKSWLQFHEKQTAINFNFQQEINQQFMRDNIIMSYQYLWMHNPFSFGSQKSTRSIFKPLSITLVSTVLEQGFQEQLRRTTDPEGNPLNENDLRVRAFTLRDFEPRFVTATTYIRTFINRYSGKQQQTGWFVRGQADMGGNIPYLMHALNIQRGTTEVPLQDHQLGSRDLQYSQFYRGYIDVRASKQLGPSTQLVNRIMMGAGRTFNYSSVIPLEYRFFVGGTNSVRGWQSNTLGPGTYPFELSRIISLGGEVKFEANIELRQKFISPMELAFFIDAGNVWFWAGSGFDEPRAVLNAGNLELGVAAGFGLRFDFEFIILAFDVGQQVYAPDIRGFVVQRFPQDIGSNRLQYNLGIGYPF